MLKKPASKAAASEGPKAYPPGYVEGLNDARTPLAGFFSTLLENRVGERLTYQRIGNLFP